MNQSDLESDVDFIETEIHPEPPDSTVPSVFDLSERNEDSEIPVQGFSTEDL